MGVDADRLEALRRRDPELVDQVCAELQRRGRMLGTGDGLVVTWVSYDVRLRWRSWGSWVRVFEVAIETGSGDDRLHRVLVQEVLDPDTSPGGSVRVHPGLRLVRCLECEDEGRCPYCRPDRRRPDGFTPCVCAETGLCSWCHGEEVEAARAAAREREVETYSSMPQSAASVRWPGSVMDAHGEYETVVEDGLVVARPRAEVYDDGR